jgi:DUF1680 family protein
MIARILPLLFTVVLVANALGADAWRMPDLASSEEMHLTGIWGSAQARNANRLAQKPLDKAEFILDDLSLARHRKFAEYSGDISGRWIGAAAFLMPQFPQPFAAFSAIMAKVPTYQKPDGHFGADQKLPTINRGRDMPILWGNGRLLIGLVEVYDRTGNAKALETARKLGDYFVATDPIYNRPENLRNVGGSYADGFATCYFSCIEGLAALGRVTKDDRYLAEGKRIAALAATVDNFDHLHSHGRLCAVRGFADLYALTGEPQWRTVAERDWTIFMQRYRLPTGGVKEMLEARCDRDEGCAVCDWLRLNLSLWRVTGNGRYLDEAERSLKGHFIYQQFPNGGAGHRVLRQIDGQPVVFKGLSEEAWWCCGEHWARATADIARFAVTSGPQGPSVNLAIDCEGSVAGPGGKWKVALREVDNVLHIALTSPTLTKATVRIHRPAWAEQAARIEKPASLALAETKEAWLIDGVWSGTQEITVRLPATLRSESAAGDAGVLLRGHDSLVAHRVPANAWLMDHPAKVRPVVLWAAAMLSKDGRIVVPASLIADADPNRAEQWSLLELAPLRVLTGQPHEAAWFSFVLKPASPEQITALTTKP